MRGALKLGLPIHVLSRIIPADAGSTPWTSGSTSTQVDHPRGCGEHTMPKWSVGATLGSSPRMRGALIPCPVAAVGVRIIPADAGST